MPIHDTIHFSTRAYRETASTAPTAWLREEETTATRRRVLCGVGLGASVHGAAGTGGLSVLFAAYKARSLWVAGQKLGVVRAELRARGLGLHEIDARRDVLGPAATAAVGAVVGDGVSDLFGGAVGIADVVMPPGVAPGQGLLEDPGQAVRGFEDVVDVVFGAGEGAGAGGAALSAADAVAYHAGMVQAQIIAQEWGGSAAEKIFFSPGHPDPECLRSRGVDSLSCDLCRTDIPQGSYWHCCAYSNDNYDICQRCYDMNFRCKEVTHVMKKLQTPTGPAFTDRISTTPGYSLWKPQPGTSISRSQLRSRFLFRCEFCRAEVRQGRIFRCFQCYEFDLCDECYLLGKRCSGGHDLVSALCAIDTSDCPGFIRDCPGRKDLTPPVCSNCSKSTNQGSFYHCCACEDKPGSHHYNLCYDCYSGGARCQQPGQHVLLLYLVTNGDYGTRYPRTCSRKRSSTRSVKKGGSCNRCRNAMTTGSFFHCCKCSYGGSVHGFDMCLRCYRGGRHCYNTSHALTRHWIK